MDTTRITAATLRRWLGDGRELALLDVRDGGPFARGHLLLASNLPLARLETMAPMLLPRRGVRAVLMDGGEPGDVMAGTAAARLAAHGYTALHVLDGGLRAWRDAGHEVFAGTNVPSKAFGEAVEHAHDTPRITPETLRQWQQAGRDLLMVDARPLEEFRQVSLPGAIDCPGAELALRVPAMLRSPDTVVVVNCAGRTRSIIGCQSLRNAGVSNPVVALQNGTMGWQLAGFEPAHGREAMAPRPDEASLAIARQRAQALAVRHGVASIDGQALARWLSDDDRTTYVFDVRLPEAFAAGHRPGSLNAPGGQLVQCTDAYAAVRHARMVLIDRDGVQAPMTAHWLAQMGWEVALLRDGLAGALDTGAARVPPLGADALAAPRMDAAALQQRLSAGGAVVVDVGDSWWWRSARIPGSYFAMRSGLAGALQRFDRGTPLVFACGDGRLAPHAAEDARALGFGDVSVLAGGRAAWRAAGLPTERCRGDDDPALLTASDDMWYPPWARPEGAVAAMQQYLTWEVNLLGQLAREPYLRFKVGAHADA